MDLELASFLENRVSDVIDCAKNTIGEGGINFKMQYQAQDGNIWDYSPGFFVSTGTNTFFTFLKPKAEKMFTTC